MFGSGVRPLSSLTIRLTAVATALLLTASACSGSDGNAEGITEGSTAPSTSTPPSTTAVADTATADDDPTLESGTASAGCGTPATATTPPPDGPGDVELTLTSGGIDRIYRLAIPEAYDPDVPAPLIFNLHGSGSNAIWASTNADLPRRAGTRGFITVAPQANGTDWELSPAGADADFLLELLDTIQSSYCIDLTRTHAMGLSLGAWKAAATACELDGRFASLALVTVEVFPGVCEPMPAVAFHGTADNVMPYGEGGEEVVPLSAFNATLPGALENMRSWATSGGCQIEPTTEAIGDDVILRRYPACSAGVEVELYTVLGGGHTWPGAVHTVGPPEFTTQTISATDLALDFFEAHPRI